MAAVALPPASHSPAASPLPCGLHRAPTNRITKPPPLSPSLSSPPPPKGEAVPSFRPHD